MGRFFVCAECAGRLCELGGTRVVPADGEGPIEIAAGQHCELHPGAAHLQAWALVSHPATAETLRAALTPTPRRETIPAPSMHETTGVEQRPGVAAPLGPVTEVAARLLAQWLSEEPFEAQRGPGAGDQVYVSRAASVARMLLQETRNL